ncbi:hypothetical protein HYT26_00385 [Candidatus Pacearchaeota archaeon]|nr:hypothetical protein [Candidatus Pacearchaeota archaeon]
MKKYITLDRKEYNIDTFPPKEKALYERVKSYYDNNKPEWIEFANFWMAHLHLSGIEDDYTREEIIKLPIWDICNDLEGRIGIALGFVKEPEDKNAIYETGEIIRKV